MGFTILLVLIMQRSESLLSDDSLLVSLAVGPSLAPPTCGSVTVQRAALNFATTLCGDLDFPRSSLLTLLERLLYCLVNPHNGDVDPVLKAKVLIQSP